MVGCWHVCQHAARLSRYMVKNILVKRLQFRLLFRRLFNDEGLSASVNRIIDIVSFGNDRLLDIPSQVFQDQ